MRVQRVAAFVVVGEGIGRRRSGMEVAKRMMRIKGMEGSVVLDIVLKWSGGGGGGVVGRRMGGEVVDDCIEVVDEIT